MESQVNNVGIAKTADSVDRVTSPVIHPDSKPFGYTGNSFNGIPIEMYRHFDLEISKIDNRTVDKLGKIYSYFKKQDGVSNIGDLLMRVKEGERKLGRGGTINPLNKLYNWVGLSDHIDSMQKERKAMEV